MIATTAAFARFTGQKMELEQIRVIAQNVEAQLIRVPTGCQDYYPALYGGVSAIHLDADGIHHEAVRDRRGRAGFALCARLHRSATQVRHQQLGSIQVTYQRRSQDLPQL